MPITVDMGETIWGKELFDKGKRNGILEGERRGKLEGESLILQRQLVKRFGLLPDWAKERIE